MKTSLLILIFCLMLIIPTGCEPEQLPSEVTQDAIQSVNENIVNTEGNSSRLSGETDPYLVKALGILEEYGVVPEGYGGAAGDGVRYQDAVNIVSKTISVFYKQEIDIEKELSDTIKDKSELTRMDIATIMVEGMKAVWGMYPAPNGDVKLPDEYKDRMCADDHLIWDNPESKLVTIPLWNNAKMPLTVVSALFATRNRDKTDGTSLLPLDEAYQFHPGQKVTKVELVEACVRLYRSLDPLPNYVLLKDVSKHTIPNTLYNGDTTLPEASNQSIPNWHGILYFPKCWSTAEAFGDYIDSNYRESDFVAMKEAGLNLVVIYINPTRLSWPYMDEDVNKVNLVELEALDQAIAWAFEHGFHVQLGISGVPGVGRYNFGEQFQHELLFEDDLTTQLFAEIWAMLARRYQDIPNRYLGFNLFNEIDPPNDEAYLRAFEPAIDAIWAVTPQRLLIADIHANSITGESMAKKGVALSRHQYALPIFDYDLTKESDGLMELYPNYTKELTWPQVFLPSMLHGSTNTITLEGEFSQGELTIGINQLYDGSEVLSVLVDGVEALEVTPHTTGDKNVWNMLVVNQEYTVVIPAKTQRIELRNKEPNGIVVYNRLKLTQQDREDLILYPHDTFNVVWEPMSATIVVDLEGKIEQSRMLTWEDIKGIGDSISYNSIQKIAGKHGVGFLVGEFGPFGSGGLPKDVLEGYLSMMLEGFEEDNTAWVHSMTVGSTNLLHTSPAVLPDYEMVKVEHSPYYMNVFIKDILKGNSK